MGWWTISYWECNLECSFLVEPDLVSESCNTMSRGKHSLFKEQVASIFPFANKCQHFRRPHDNLLMIYKHCKNWSGPYAFYSYKWHVWITARRITNTNKLILPIGILFSSSFFVVFCFFVFCFLFVFFFFVFFYKDIEKNCRVERRRKRKRREGDSVQN